MKSVTGLVFSGRCINKPGGRPVRVHRALQEASLEGECETRAPRPAGLSVALNPGPRPRQRAVLFVGTRDIVAELSRDCVRYQ